MTTRTARVALLDIEGTLAPIAFVHEVLFPFARRALPDFLRRHWQREDVVAARRQIVTDAAGDARDGNLESPAALCGHLLALMDRDSKATGLKALQGMIWREGFLAGALRSQVFADVPQALRRWRDAGVRIAIYSSGSIEAQRLFVRYADAGDLSPLFDAYFDTTSGSKQSAESYTRIASALAVPPAEVVFASDSVAELHAASHAGMQVLLARRPGNPPTEPAQFAQVASFDELALTGGGV